MFDLGPHAAFIWAAYALTAAVIAILIVWVFVGEARQRRILDELDSRGIVRRSARTRDSNGDAAPEKD